MIEIELASSVHLNQRKRIVLSTNQTNENKRSQVFDSA